MQKQSDPKNAPYWNNRRLVKAKHLRTAFRRATEMGRMDAEPTKAFRYQQKFVGITDLVPIYDPFEHGGEILWEELWPTKNQRNTLPLKVYAERELEKIYERSNTTSDRIAHPRRVRKPSR